MNNPYRKFRMTENRKLRARCAGIAETLRTGRGVLFFAVPTGNAKPSGKRDR